ncbi:MAG: metallophosphoesterase [Clostridia bacterium]|nr:metallophosphoesterase [Clostridia bacterium]
MAKMKVRNVNVRKNNKALKKKILLTILIVVLVAVAAFIAANIIINQNFTVSFYQVRCDKVSDNIRIVELADLHNAQYGKDNEKLVAKIKALKPDLIFYAGDMMNYKDSDYSVLFSLSDQLSEVAPIYACYGNNEIDQYLFEDKSFTEQLESHHVDMLSNEAIDVKVGNTTLQLIAVSDDLKQYDIESNNGKKFVESLEPTDNCRICLTHYPELFKEKLLNKGIDVAFTGHAHGGLIRVPHFGGLYSTGEGFLPEFTSGVKERDDGTQVVISRGLGNSGYIPRINNQPELVVVDLCWY